MIYLDIPHIFATTEKERIRLFIKELNSELQVLFVLMNSA